MFFREHLLSLQHMEQKHVVFDIERPFRGIIQNSIVANKLDNLQMDRPSLLLESHGLVKSWPQELQFKIESIKFGSQDLILVNLFNKFTIFENIKDCLRWNTPCGSTFQSLTIWWNRNCRLIAMFTEYAQANLIQIFGAKYGTHHRSHLK